jgi:hypothetical protein
MGRHLGCAPDPDYLATLVDNEDKLLTQGRSAGRRGHDPRRRDRRAKDDAFSAASSAT